MALTTVTCIVLTCDVCGDGWAHLDAEPHFTGRGAATAYAVAAGWIVTRSRAVCSDCTVAEACALSGHRWGPWTQAGPFPRDDGSPWEGMVRHCATCSAAEWDPPPARRPGVSPRQAG